MKTNLDRIPCFQGQALKGLSQFKNIFFMSIANAA